MNPEYLVTMANDIAAFFASESGPDAPKSIASHITRFWDPRMRRAIVEHYRSSGGSGLSDGALKAVALIAAEATAAGQAANKNNNPH